MASVVTRVARTMIVALVAALLSPLVPAQQAAEAQVARQQTVAYLVGWLKSMLELRDDLQIDASLRQSLESMASGHQARMKPVFEQWVADRARNLAAGPNYADELQRRVLPMFMNEMALWRLETPGAAYDEVLAPVFARSRHCHDRDGKSYFAKVALLLQDVPPEHRQVMLEGERVLFSRWGTARATLPARPVPSLREREEAVVAVMRDGGELSGPALPPILAFSLLVENDREPDMSPDLSCALHAWGLRHALATGSLTRSEAINAYRFAMEPPTAEWMPMPSGARDRPKSAGPDAYPPVAATYDVQGSVTLRIVLDAEGRFKRASVVRRDIRVGGIPGRAVAFETLLDEGSIARAAVVKYPKPDAAQLKGGMFVAEQTIGWKLE